VVSIVTQGLTVRRGGRVVLDDVSAEFRPGAFVGIIGPNGAGKSTLVQAMLGLIAPAEGRVQIDGIEVARAARKQIAQRVAYLPQGQTVHWPMSVARLVELGRLPHLAPLSRVGDTDRGAVERAMARTDVAHLADRTVTDLSGGERARVLLARALAVEAPALVVDEPLASLDPGHQLAIMEVLAEQVAAGVLVIAVLHDLGLAARFCQRLLLLHDGRIHADGAPAEVLTTKSLDTVYGIRAFHGAAGDTPLIVPTSRTR
jgi:iron complex transport system ATP-binding protein